jgi:hypothetical protein
MSAVVLSRGASWNPRPDKPPYLLAEVGHPWPTDADAYVVFTDSTGGELLTVDCTITPDVIQPFADIDDVAGIPAGTNFEIFLETSASTDKIRYGKVSRHEAPLSNAPATDISNQVLRFTDTFPTLGLRSNWKAVAGRARVHGNAGLSLPNSVGPNFDGLFSNSAIRWDTPLNGDSAKIHVTVIDPLPIVFQAKTTIILCADQRFTSFLGVQFESSSGTNHLRVGTGDSPFAFTDRADPVVHDVINSDDYTIQYDELTKKLFIYQGEDLTPLLSWTDSMDVMPHGPGYTYLGMAFQASLTPLGPGVQVTGWQATDGA